MSSLTKIMIVLLTVATFFLSAMVVTYVASADNFKDKYTSTKTDKDSLNAKLNSTVKQYNEAVSKHEQQQKKLNDQISSLRTELDTVRSELDAASAENSALLQKVNSFASIVEGFTQTNENQGQLLQNTLDELHKTQSLQIKQEKELNETTAALEEKMAVIETLQADKKRLLEEKTDLQGRLNKTLQPIGKEAAPAITVTPQTDTVTIVQPAQSTIGTLTENIELSGKVTAVDSKNNMASISLGAADGVREGMKFHVIRGEQFICDILVIYVDTEEAVGVLKLVQQQPTIGDSVTTNL